MNADTLTQDAARLWRFTPLDTPFFRDGRPFNAGDSVWLESRFPPSGRTLQGAVRNAVVSHLEQWEECDFTLDLAAVIGGPDDLGRLRFGGPFLRLEQDWLFPVPLDLYYDKEKTEFRLCRPTPRPVCCDLGPVRLPYPRFKRAQDKYLSGTVLADLLVDRCDRIQPVTNDGGAYSGNLWHLFADDPDTPALAKLEPKVGLARDNQTRRYKEGMLYSIAPVRLLQPETSLGLIVRGLASELEPPTPFVQRLGGEGKLAEVMIQGCPDWPAFPGLTPEQDKVRFRLVFITPVRFNGCGGWLPQGFMTEVEGDAQVWRGTLMGRTGEGKDIKVQNMSIVSACLGDVVRIGGWDMLNNAPRRLEGFFPAGSVYFCEAPADQAATIESLHAGWVGEDCEYGFGQLLIGKWGESGDE